MEIVFTRTSSPVSRVFRDSSREVILNNVSPLSHHIQTFSGNEDNNDHVKNYIYPPIFSRFIRIVPRSWKNSITMRIELLGCNFE